MSEELAEKIVEKIRYIIDERENDSYAEAVDLIQTVIKAYS